MSAVRTSRRSSRVPQSPYSRPPAKKSSWSITGFLKSLVPWSSAETHVEDEYTLQEDLPTASSSPAVSLMARGHELERESNEQETFLRPIPPTPPRPPSPLISSAKSTLFDPTSPERNLETVSAHLRESLDKKDVEKLCVMLQSDPPEEDPQPFRFSVTPSTPGRGNSPFQRSNGLGSTFGISSSTRPPVVSPRKTLNRNPNGVYRWQGGGSAKTPRSKNRYSSPAFGPSRSTSNQFVLKDTQIGMQTPRTDTKRRKVAEDINTSSTSSDTGATLIDTTPPKPPARAAAPDPSPTRIKQALPFPVSAGSPITPRPSNTSNAISSSSMSRLRVPPIAQKPTAPVVPSPLRQAWSGGSPSSQNDPSTTPSPSKQTKAANFMTELIKEVTPPKRPDLSNPYQTASPLGKVASAPKGRVSKRVRATGKPTAPVKKDEKSKEKGPKAVDQEKVFSPQAIIEATLPKGSKRSRPPAHFEKISSSNSESSLPKQSSQAGSSSNHERYAPSAEEEIDEDQDARRTVKKSKFQSIGRDLPTAVNRTTSDSPDIIIEEVEVVEASIKPEKPQSVTSPSLPSGSTSNTVPGRPVFPGFKAAAIPKEPSKLRYSYQPETSLPTPEVTAPIVSPFSIPTSTSHPTSFFSPSPSTFAPAASLSSTSSTPVSTPPAPLSFPSSTAAPKSSVAPSFSPFSSPASVAPQVPGSVTSFRGDSSTTILKPGQQAALNLPASSLPSFTFSIKVGTPVIDSAHVKAVKKAKSIPLSSLPSFDFTKEAVPTMPSVSAKAVSIMPPTSAPIVPFNWAGAGVKAPDSSNDTTWTCSLCMLTNPMSAIEQCEHCETKRPSSSATAPVASTSVAPKRSTPVQQFNWTAAGMKPPTAGGDSWTCSLCGLSNPASATDKCNTCDNPRA